MISTGASFRCSVCFVCFVFAVEFFDIKRKQSHLPSIGFNSDFWTDQFSHRGYMTINASYYEFDFDKKEANRKSRVLALEYFDAMFDEKKETKDAETLKNPWEYAKLTAFLDSGASNDDDSGTDLDYDDNNDTTIHVEFSDEPLSVSKNAKNISFAFLKVLDDKYNFPLRDASPYYYIMATDNAKAMTNSVDETPGLELSLGFAHLGNTACKHTVNDVKKNYAPFALLFDNSKKTVTKYKKTGQVKHLKHTLHSYKPIRFWTIASLFSSIYDSYDEIHLININQGWNHELLLFGKVRLLDALRVIYHFKVFIENLEYKQYPVIHKIILFVESFCK